MPFPARILIVLIILFHAIVALDTAAAFAEEGFLPFQIPPWIEQSDDSVETTDIARKPPQTNAKTPRLLAPDDYKDLLARMQPVIDNADPPSPLEDMYSKRVVDEVRQFGYDMFQTQRGNETEQKRNADMALPAGAVQDNFVLNFGDKLNIVFRGQRREQGIYSITNDGLLIVEDMAPVPAAGRTIGQVRAALETMASDLHNTDVYVALDSVRQVNVLVVGHVRHPGRQTLTVFHTVLDALIQAGGIEKTGTLRQIKLVREGRTQVIDLYGLLVYGSAGMDMTLRDGDRILIPPIGPTVAITGGVKRPGIYEILPSLKGMRHRPDESSEKLSLQEALDLAGGLLSPGNNRFIRLDLTSDGRERTEDLTAPFVPALGDGSILAVERADEQRTETVELTGHTRQPGIHALGRAPTLSALLSDARVLGPDIYPLIGVIERTDTRTMAHQLIDFPPRLVIAGEYDRKLQDGDIVSLFSRRQMMALQKPGEPQGKSEEGSADDPGDGPLDSAMESFLKERSVYVRGAVRDPGPWPVSEGTTLDSAIAIAGGLTLEANTANIEVTTALRGGGHQDEGRSGTGRIMVDYRETDPNTVAIAPGDAIRINQKYGKTEGQSVMIAGEVYHPGKYDLLPGDTLGRLMERAGGITDQAYPDGAIFSRDSDRRAEEARFRAAARELERSIAAAAAGDDKKGNAPDAEQIAMARDLADELKNVEAVGRITVQADPAILKTHPEQDILLETGDRIYIPRRGLTVRVHGEVLSPASLQFREDKTPLDYIAEAGGMTYYADDERAFILYPDGSAQPLLVSAWNHKAVFVPPGSTIVVPRDPKPFDFMATARDFTQVLSNLAITGIFLSDIKDGD
jgi:protein involved in polysaccharide export with SLBB domain